MKVVIGIPARMESKRFPGKPLCDILGKSMIEHVYERCSLTELYTFVATCNQEIYDEVRSFGGEVFMTKPDIKRAGLRVAEACKENIDLSDNDIVIIVQGDEPLIHPEMIHESYRQLIHSNVFCTNMIRKATEQDLRDTNEIKVVMDKYNNALYFSRSPIPFLTKFKPNIYKQVCIFAFKYKDLLNFQEFSETPLEKAESIEMLRVLEHGYKIKLIKNPYITKSVDNEKDRKEVEELMKNDKIWKLDDARQSSNS